MKLYLCCLSMQQRKSTEDGYIVSELFVSTLVCAICCFGFRKCHEMMRGKVDLVVFIDGCCSLFSLLPRRYYFLLCRLLVPVLRI
jgi:hypothetical protein